MLELFEVCDVNCDGCIDFVEFWCYVNDKEIELFNFFEVIDVLCDGVF